MAKNPYPLLFVANEQTGIWLPGSAARGMSAEALLECVHSDRWQIPRHVRALFDMPRAVRLQAFTHAGIVAIWCDPPLVMKPVERGCEYWRALRLLRQKGLTNCQIAIAYQRSKRWVQYQFAGEHRQECGTTDERR